jgi:hypothetical protein
MNSYNTYISKYGNISHILNIFVNEDLCENDKNTIMSTICDMLNDKEIYIFNIHILLKWRVSNEKDLLHYYTDGCGMLGDKAVQEHTKMVLNDITEIIGKDKFSFTITKPLTKRICII